VSGRVDRMIELVRIPGTAPPPNIPITAQTRKSVQQIDLKNSPNVCLMWSNSEGTVMLLLIKSFLSYTSKVF